MANAQVRRPVLASPPDGAAGKPAGCAGLLHAAKAIYDPGTGLGTPDLGAIEQAFVGVK